MYNIQSEHNYIIKYYTTCQLRVSATLQLCYIIKYYTTCQLRVSATLLGHHQDVLSLQRTVLHNHCI